MKFVIKNKEGQFLQSFGYVDGYIANIIMCQDEASAKTYKSRVMVECVCKKLNREENVYSTHFYNEAEVKREFKNSCN